MSEQKRHIRRYFATCSGADADAVAEHFTADAIIYDTNHPPIVGRGEIGRFWEHVAKRWAGARWEVDSAVEEGPAVAIEWTMRGSGRAGPFVVRGSEHYRFEDGLIAEIRQYWTYDEADPSSGLHGYPYTSDESGA